MMMLLVIMITKNMISLFVSAVFICFAVFARHVKGGLQCSSNKTVLNINTKVYPDKELFSTNAYINTSCTWNITARTEHVVFLDVKIYDFTHNKTFCKQNETIQVFDGPTALPNNLIYGDCVNPHGKKVFTSDRFAIVKYTPPYNANFSKGFWFFQVIVSSFKKTSCFGVKNVTAPANSTGNISSPHYRYGYPKDNHCTWRISAPVGYIIKLDIEATLACESQRLEFYDSEQDEPQNQLLGNLCRASHSVVTSTGNVIYIMFFGNSTDLESIIDNYFIIRYNTFLPGTSCSQSNTADQNKNIIIRGVNPQGTIQSPNFPQKYPTWSSCRWKLIAPSGYAIKLFMKTIWIKSRQCSIYDYLRIYDGFQDKVSINLDFKSCWSSRKPSFYTLSSGNKMRIEFTSGGSEVIGYGFQAMYTFEPLGVNGTCGENRTGTIHLRGQGASFFSPGYRFTNKPQHPKNMTCIWNITVEPGYTIQLRYKQNNLNIGCHSEYAKTYDGRSCSGPLLGTICKGTNLNVLFSSGNNMVVEMKTSASNQRGKGIVMTYRAVKYKKTLYRCTEDNRSLKIENKKIATVMSPWYPMEYPNNMICIYSFQAPFASIANVNITSLNLQESDNCEADRLRVKELGPSWTSHVFCGKKLAPIKISSSGRKLNLEFKTDWRYQFPGFEAVFFSTEDESFGDCNIEGQDNLIYMNTSSGVFHSPRYPKGIPANMKCTWVLTAPEGSYVRLDIHYFDLDYTCTGGSELEVRDGPSSTSKKVGTYCKKHIPRSFFSSGRYLWVRFNSDRQSVVDKGFNASYSTVTSQPSYAAMSCVDGQTTKIQSSSGEIASSPFPLDYSNDIDCRWQITVPDGKRIKLTFESFHLQDSLGCSGDFVEVFDGLSTFSESLGKFCGTKKPEAIHSDNTWLYIQFKTDKSGQYPGFKASFEAVLSIKSIIMIVMFTLVGVGVLCSILGWCLKGRVYTHNPEPSPPDGASSTAGSRIELTSKM